MTFGHTTNAIVIIVSYYYYYYFDNNLKLRPNPEATKESSIILFVFNNQQRSRASVHVVRDVLPVLLLRTYQLVDLDLYEEKNPKKNATEQANVSQLV